MAYAAANDDPVLLHDLYDFAATVEMWVRSQKFRFEHFHTLVLGTIERYAKRRT